MLTSNVNEGFSRYREKRPSARALDHAEVDRHRPDLTAMVASAPVC